MTRRKKIIIFSIIAIIIIAIIWFFIQRNKQQSVQSQTGNVSALFPFTGTNVTDYQPEPGGTAPSNIYSTGGFGGTGSTGGGAGAGGTGVTNVLNLNDLRVGTGGIGLGLGGIGGGNNNTGNNNNGGGGSCTGEFCPGTPCPACLNPYYGQITLKANGVSSANLTSDGGIVELSWTVGNGASPDSLNTICTANSSDGSWTGEKTPNGGPDTLNVSANNTPGVLSKVYTLTCTGIGSATATVNESSSLSNDVILGSSIKITASYGASLNKQSISLPSTGGRVELAWTVTLPANYHGAPPVACIASSSGNDWMGGTSMPTTISGTMTATSAVVELPNDGDNFISNTYTISCDHVGVAVATVNIDSITHGGIIAGSAIKIVASYGTNLNKQSINIPQIGGQVTLAWTVTLPASYRGDPAIFCKATSSANDWSGAPQTTVRPTPILGTMTSTSSVNEVSNTTSDIISNTYTITCDHVGVAVATVNISPLSGGGVLGIIPGSSIGITAGLTQGSGKQSIQVPSGGGNVYLNWTATLPNSYAGGPIACRASSSDNDWTGGPKMPATISAGTSSLSSVFEPANNGSDNLTKTYTIECERIGKATATVSITSLLGGGIIKGSTITLTVATSTTVANPRPSLSLPSDGDKVYLQWKVTLPGTYNNIPPISCIASSSAGDWVDNRSINPAPPAINNQKTVTINGLVVEPSNKTSDVISRTYTIKCNNVGSATATVNINPPKSNFGVITDYFTLEVNNSFSARLTSDGGPVTLAWTIFTDKVGPTHALAGQAVSTSTRISNPIGPNCTATSSAKDWSGIKTYKNDGTGNQDLSIPPNTGTSTLTRTYTMSCVGLGIKTVTVNTNISPYANASRNPVFKLTVDGATKTTVAPGTPVELAWEVKNIDADTCLGSSTGTTTDGRPEGPFSGWGIIVRPPLSTSTSTTTGITKTVPGTVTIVNPTGFTIVGPPSLATSTSGATPGKTTIKQPFSSVGTIATSFSEIVGADNSSSGGLFDIPITGSRKYTLTCGKLPPQSVVINVDKSQGNNESTKPSLEFLGNNLNTPSIGVGDTVDLTWKVSNIPANSCFASSDGQYVGWGYSYQKIRHVKKADGTIVDSTTYVLQPGDFEYYTNDLVADSGGTPKAPTEDVGTNIQSFTETVGSDSPITSARTYTLTCGSITKNVTINVENKPVLSFLVNGQKSDSVSTGATADLTWEVKNIKGGSCRGTSTGFTGVGANGNFPGWGSDYIANMPKNINPGFGFVAQQQYTAPAGFGVSYSGNPAPSSGGDLFAPSYGIPAQSSPSSPSGGGTGQTQNLDTNLQFAQNLYGGKTEFFTIAGGTPKDPKNDVGSVTQKFTETIGKDGSIMDGVERDYTLTCASILDGSPVFKTIVINGPADITTGTTTITPNNPLGTSANPCDNDLDIKSAQIQLTNLLATYKTLTGYTIGNYGNGNGDDPKDYLSPDSDVSSSTILAFGTGTITTGKYYNTKDSAGLIDECWSETTRDPSNAESAHKMGIELPYVFEEGTKNTIPTKNSLTREAYPNLSYDDTWHDVNFGWDGTQNPLVGWKWNYYSYTDANGTHNDYTNSYPDENGNMPKLIYVGDLASGIVVDLQSKPGNSDSSAAGLGRFWLSLPGGGTDIGHLMDTSAVAVWNRFTGAGKGGQDTTNFSFDCGGEQGPFWPAAPAGKNMNTNPGWGLNGATNPSVCGGMATGGPVNSIYTFILGRNDGNVVDSDTYTDPNNTDLTPSSSDKTSGGYYIAKNGACLEPDTTGKMIPVQNIDPKSQFYGRYYAAPMCGPGIVAVSYVKDNGAYTWGWYSGAEMSALGKRFGY